MLWTLVQKEIVSHILTLRFAVAFVLITLFTFAGFYVSVSEYKENMDNYHALEGMAKNDFDRAMKEQDNESKVDRLYWSQGVTAPIPTPPMSAISQGLSAVWPTAFNIRGQGDFNLGKGMLQDASSSNVMLPDYIYIVNTILSLLALLFIFDAISGEKEAGTLRLMLSFPVPRSHVLLSKWLGGLLVLLAPFLVATVGGIGYAWTQGALQLSAGAVVLIALLVLTGFLYFSAFFTLGLFVSTLTKRAFTSLFICLFIWVIFILLIPNLAPVISRILAPLPSPRKIEAEKETIDRETEVLKNALWISVNGANGLDVIRKDKLLKEDAEYRKTQWDRYLKRAQERQTAISENLGRISPSSSWIYAANALLKTGPMAYRNMLDGRLRFSKELKTWVFNKYENPALNGEVAAFTADDVPTLRIQFYDTARAVAGALNDMLLLLVFNVLFFMAAFRFFLRYDVR